MADDLHGYTSGCEHYARKYAVLPPYSFHKLARYKDTDDLSGGCDRGPRGLDLTQVES